MEVASEGRGDGEGVDLGEGAYEIGDVSLPVEDISCDCSVRMPSALGLSFSAAAGC